MSAKHWIIGCALTIAVAAPAAAAGVSGDFGNFDVNGTQHTAGATNRTVDSGSTGGGDVAGLSHPGTSQAAASESTDPGVGNGSSNTEDSPANSSARQPTARHAVGWQSLLPGSIQ